MRYATAAENQKIPFHSIGNFTWYINGELNTVHAFVLEHIATNQKTVV